MKPGYTILKGSFLTIFIILSSIINVLQAQPDCDVTKDHGQGYSTTISSVLDNLDNTYTIVLTVEHDGCPGPQCHALAHYSVEADEGTYSDIYVEDISGSVSYGGIVMGPNLGSGPIEGFKISGGYKRT